MTLSARGVTPGRKARSNELPSELAAGAVQLARLVDSGVVQRVEQELRLSRRGGFGGLELFAFLVLYLSAGPQSSIRAFSCRNARSFSQIAAIVRRRMLPSAASVSRALAKLPAATVHRFTDMLLGVSGRRELLSHPAVVHRDSRGDSWHVFDHDPTTRAFRERDLPTGADLPEPERRVEAVPGYVGRKRGEVRQQDHLLMHAGSGLWAYYRLNTDGGSAAPYFSEAAATARRWVDEIEHPASRTLVRADGEFGHAAAVRACGAQGIHFLVRLSRYHLFERPEVKAALSRAVWHPVTGSIVAREAADLGTVMLYEADGDTHGVTTRVVVTRIRTGGAQAHRGVIDGEYQLEMFGTSLPADAWSAEDVATLYAGRAVIENSFAQQDHEYDLDRTFSYTGTGQAFCVAVGLFLWNDAICRGAAAVGLPKRLPKQQPRPERPASSCEQPAAPEPVEPDVDEPISSSKAEPAEEPRPEHRPPDPTVSQSIKDVLREAAVGRRFANGWHFDQDGGVLRCPENHPLHAYHVEVSRTGDDGAKVGADRISLRSAVGICDGCPLRPQCFSSEKRNAYKQATWWVPRELAARMKPLLAAERTPRSAVRRARRREVRVQPLEVGKKLFVATDVPPSGAWIPEPPWFAPGAARRKVRDALREVTAEVVVNDASVRRHRRHALLRPGTRTRMTWAERRRRAQIPRAADVIARAPRANHSLLGILSA